MNTTTKVVAATIVVLFVMGVFFHVTSFKTDEKIIKCPNGNEAFYSKYSAYSCGNRLAPESAQIIENWNVTTWDSYDLSMYSLQKFWQIFSISLIVFGGMGYFAGLIMTKEIGRIS